MSKHTDSYIRTNNRRLKKELEIFPILVAGSLLLYPPGLREDAVTVRPYKFFSSQNSAPPFSPSTSLFCATTLGNIGGVSGLGGVLESIVHKSAYSGPINMISSVKWIFYVLPIHVACSIMQIGPLAPKLQQVTGLRGR